jgi:hypothetical protein
MSFVLGVRFPSFGESTPIIIVNKNFGTQYGRFGLEKEFDVISVVFYEQIHDDKLYAKSIERIDTLYASGKIKGAKLVADYTASGRVAIDMLREKGLLVMPLMVSESEKQTTNTLGGFAVPLNELITTTQRLICEKRLKFAAELKGTEALIGELTRPYRDSTEYSDAVLCLCGAVWYSHIYIQKVTKRRNKDWPKAGHL